MASGSASDEVFAAGMADFFNNSNVGLAVFDEKLRYRAINPWLASVHGYSVDFHIGKTVRTILGEVAAVADPAIRRVFATGRPISNLEIGGKLPTKTEPERWVDNLFPIKNQWGEVHQVGAVVVPVPANRTDEKIVVHREAPALRTILRSWKDIANYVGTCAKTVQRWEQAYKFPIRRLKVSKGAVVFAMREEVDNWLSQGARTALGDKRSWATFINAPLPTLILNDERIVLDANISMANLIGTTAENLVGKNLDALTCDTIASYVEQEWLLFCETGAMVALRNFRRVEGEAFAAEYTLRTMQPGIRILTLTSLRDEPVAATQIFHRTGPAEL